MPPLTKPGLGATFAPAEPPAKTSRAVRATGCSSLRRGTRHAAGTPWRPASRGPLPLRNRHQGRTDVALLASCHRWSQPSCSKSQAADGLSRLCSRFGRNQPEEGWGNGPKKQGSREEDPRSSDSEWKYRISMPQRLPSSTLHVKVPGCRNNPTTQHSHHFPSTTSSSKLLVSDFVICILVSQWDSPHFKQSDLNTDGLKTNYHLFLAFSVFRNTIDSHCSCQCRLLPCSASCFPLFPHTTERLLSPAHGYSSHNGSGCS